MRNPIYGIAAAVFISVSAPVHAQSQLELTLDAYVAVVRASGATVEYSDRIIGDNGSVEYLDFQLVAPNGELDLQVEWVRFEPQPLQPEMTLVTFAPKFQALINPDDSDQPVNVSISSDDLQILTNAIVIDPEELEKVDFRMSAGTFLLATEGTGAGAPIEFNFNQADLNLSILIDQIARRVTGAYSTTNFDLDYAIDADGMKMAGNSTVADLAAEFFFDMPSEDAPEAYFSDGKEFRFTYTSGPSASSGNSNQQGMEIVYDTKSQGSEALLEHVDGAVTYTASGDALEVNLSLGNGMPPMSFSLGKMSFDFAMPTRPSETAGDARLGFVLTDIVADENMWGMIDAEGVIPRDPALIDVRLAAKIKLHKEIEEIFSPMGPVARGAVPPTQVAAVESFEIISFEIAVGGASITADGALTFDNSGPLPVPSGDIQIVLSGIQGLSTKLVSLGLIDQMQAGMAMGMMMGFARPGDQPDQFVSDISFTEGGILANGVPIGP